MVLYMDNNNIIAGTEVLIKHARQGRFRFHGYSYTKANVTRVTKARIFVRYAHNAEAAEREFNKADLTERSKDSSWNRDSLVVGDEIATVEAILAAEKARSALESDGAVAFGMLATKFSPDNRGGYNAMGSRKDDEIRALIAAVEALLAKVAE